jgi:hypothetical protein
VLLARDALDEAAREAEATLAMSEGLELMMRVEANVSLAERALRLARFDVAHDHARAACAAALDQPQASALAHATLAEVHLATGRLDDARATASQGMLQLEAAGNLVEGEALVRLTWAEALTRCGDERAKEAVEGARAWMLARAAHIRDKAQRETFLAMPHHARILALI